MKAITLFKLGGPEHLTLADIPTPEPGGYSHPGARTGTGSSSVARLGSKPP